MTETLRINKGVEESVQYLLRYLLESRKIMGVFALKRLSENKSGNAVAYSLITDVDAVDDSAALFPVMPRNAGGLVAQLTQKGEVPDPVAIFVRPCELRALVELTKRNRSNLKNLFIISSTCGGVYPTKMAINGELEKDLPKYWNVLKNNEIAENIKTTCKSCEEFVPYNADMTVMVAGGGNLDEECCIFLNSAKAEEFATGMDGEITTQKLPSDILNQIHGSRQAEKKRRYNEIGVGSLNINGVVNVFGKCIGCLGCRTVCPICYCELCTFDTQNSQYKLSEKELKRKGGIRIPPGTVFYHLTRLLHVSISCVGCGSCEDVCPVEIPLGSIYKKVGEDVQSTFDYLPGKNMDEEIPIKTFEPDEYTEIED
jgi:formate dehydrogenase subunit beta